MVGESEFRPSDESTGWFCIEPMREVDLSEVLAIEQASFKYPWKGASFEAEMEKPYAGLKVARVKTLARPLVGYVCFWLVVDELQVTNIAVHSHYRRRGLGEHLLMHALQLGYHTGARSAVLEVAWSNRPARALYEKLGFVALHSRPGYYSESNEDALVMGLSLDQWEVKGMKHNTVEADRGGMELERSNSSSLGRIAI
jgi:ribosomal-protein-alanine N-acetyltransferase